ncbi:MAG: hypothetical protein HRT87_00045 [Legionellales bacterium]|nr:hypothetical protein [Legionellales bacterium]
MNLSNNKISDILSLSSLKNLMDSIFDNKKIYDISSLADLKDLIELYLDKTSSAIYKIYLISKTWKRWL